nr:hypothetical protein B0A51_06699 [Rachicladosporium sp. CCFEE 5018]
MAHQSIWRRAKDELGLTTLLNSPRDVHLLLLTRCIRMFAYGSSTLILAIYFAALGHSDTKIGLFMTLTLVGDVAISLLLTLVADRLGRRKILVAGGLLMALSGVVFASFESYWILLAAAVVGVISPSGNEIGPFRAVEESTLAHLTDAKTRSDVFAFYVVVGTLGAAAGSLTCGWLTQSLISAGWTEVSSYRVVFWVYAIAGLTKAGITLLLSEACEAPKPTAVSADGGDEQQAFLPTQPTTPATPPPKKSTSLLAQISPSSRLILLKLCGLFFFDSLASGMVPNSLVAFYMERKFALPQGKLGTIIAIAGIMSSIGNIFASAIAKRIGLVKTMVFTHLPSAILLALVPLPPSVIITVIILVARASLSSMDQAPRSAFLSAVVLPNERTAVMGIVNTIKTMSQSSGPLLTGSLAQSGNFWIAFVVAGTLKAGYDVGMLTMFVSMRLEGDKSKGGEVEGERHELREASQGHEGRLSFDDLSSDEDAGDHRNLAASNKTRP